MTTRTGYPQHPSQTMPRSPAFVLYPDDEKNRAIIEKFWKGVMGSRYAFSEVNRILWRNEAERIKKEETVRA